jgi:hypothetical protein
MGQSTAALTAALVVALSAGAATLNAQQNAATTTNGLEPTPLLGWSSWSFLRKEPTADKVEAQARAMRDSGLLMDGRDEENQRGHRCGCPTAWGGLIPGQGALKAYRLTRIRLDRRAI